MSKPGKFLRISSFLVVSIFVGYLSFFSSYKASAATNVVTKHALTTAGSATTLDVDVDSDGNAWVLYTDSADLFLKVAKVNGTTGVVSSFSASPALFRSEAAAYSQKGKYSIIAISPTVAFFTVNNTYLPNSPQPYMGDEFAKVGKIDITNPQSPQVTLVGPFPQLLGPSPKEDYISSLISGPNGSIWFTLSGSNKIGHLDNNLQNDIPATDTDATLRATTIGGHGSTGTAPMGLAKDASGNIWFARTNRADPLLKSLGKFNPATFPAVTSYAGPSSNIFQPETFYHPDACIEVANNKVFLTYSNSYTLTATTTAGELVTMKNLSTDIAGATGVGCMVKGPNNSLWMNVYTSNGNSSIIASANVSSDTPTITKYAGTEGPTTQAELAVSADGNRIWFTSGDKVGLLTLNDVTTPPPPVVDPPPPPPVVIPPPVTPPPTVEPPKTIVDKILAPKTGIVSSALTILVVSSITAGILYERKKHEKNKIKAQSEK